MRNRGRDRDSAIEMTVLFCRFVVNSEFACSPERYARFFSNAGYAAALNRIFVFGLNAVGSGDKCTYRSPLATARSTGPVQPRKQLLQSCLTCAYSGGGIEEPAPPVRKIPEVSCCKQPMKI
jgi:hypothetical protein